MKSTKYIAPKTNVCGYYAVTTLCESTPDAIGGGGGEYEAPARKLYV